MDVIGVGRQAEVLMLSDTECLKLFYEGCQKWEVEREANNTRFAYDKGLSAPKIYEVVEINGRYGIRMERLYGKTVLREALSNPDSDVDFGYLMGIEQKKIHSVSGEGLKSFVDDMCWAVNNTEHIRDSWKPEICKCIKNMPDGDRVTHTDFHCENVLMTKDGLRTIDWTGVTRGNPMADATRTYMTCTVKVYPAGITDDMKEEIDKVREKFLDGYLRGYGVKEDDFKPWMPLVAASRLKYAPEGEFDAALKLVNETFG